MGLNKLKSAVLICVVCAVGCTSYYPVSVEETLEVDVLKIERALKKSSVFNQSQRMKSIRRCKISDNQYFGEDEIVKPDCIIVTASTVSDGTAYLLWKKHSQYQVSPTTEEWINVVLTH